MGPHPVDHRCSREHVVPGFASAIMLVVVSSVVDAVLDGETGRTFVLNPKGQTWEEASDSCRELNGTLATIDHYYVIPDMGYADEWTLWVGLKINSSHPNWEDGTELTWTNWYGSVRWLEGEDAICAAAVTSLDKGFKWLPKPCHESLPSLCEIPEGTCRFNVTLHATLTAYNSLILFEARDECLGMCRTMRDLDCRSLEIHRDGNVCQVSNETRWTHPEAFALAERNWDYYHWTCINGTYLGGVYVPPNGAELPSTPEATTAAITTHPTSTETETTETTEEPEETVCVRVKPPTENETAEIEKEVKELKTMTQVYKEESKKRKKTSRPDTRGSATTVGTLAVGLVVTIVLLIVLSDIISSPDHIRQMNKRGAPWGRLYRRFKKRQRRQQTRKAMQFTEYSEAQGSSQVGPLVVGARVPQNYQPQNLQVDHNVEHIYSNGGPHGSHDVNKKLELHMERIRRMEQEFGGLRKSRMAVSCPDLDHMDTATLVAADAQSDTGVEAEGGCSPSPSRNSTTSSGTPRVRVVRLGSWESLEGNDSNENNEEHADVRSLTPCESQPKIRCPDPSNMSEAETAVGRNIHFPASLQNGQIPVLNTSKHIELSELKTLLHSQHFTRAKDCNPVETAENEDMYMQVEMNFKTPDLEADNERGQTKTGTQSSESDARPEAGNSKASLPEKRPHVQIWIEEDHSPTHHECLPGPVDVDTRLLQVQEYPCSADFKQRFRAKQSEEETCSAKILNTK